MIISDDKEKALDKFLFFSSLKTKNNYKTTNNLGVPKSHQYNKSYLSKMYSWYHKKNERLFINIWVITKIASCFSVYVTENANE